MCEDTHHKSNWQTMAVKFFSFWSAWDSPCILNDAQREMSGNKLLDWLEFEYLLVIREMSNKNKSDDEVISINARNRSRSMLINSQLIDRFAVVDVCEYFFKARNEFLNNKSTFMVEIYDYSHVHLEWFTHDLCRRLTSDTLFWTLSMLHFSLLAPRLAQPNLGSLEITFFSLSLCKFSLTHISIYTTSHSLRYQRAFFGF